MTRKEKRFLKFIKNPESLRFREIEKILLGLGFEKIHAKGSHRKYKHFRLDSDLVIPVHNNDCKPFYKKYVKKVIQTFHYFE